MDRITFQHHLEQATTLLVDFTKQFCYNECVDEYTYIITPNMRTVAPDDNHITSGELAILHVWNTYQNRRVTVGQVIDLLHHGGKVPMWIHITVWEATPGCTTIDLLCSRRLRSDDELYHQGSIMPFHIQVAIPPDHQSVEESGKFDVNWRNRLACPKKERF